MKFRMKTTNTCLPAKFIFFTLWVLVNHTKAQEINLQKQDGPRICTNPTTIRVKNTGFHIPSGGHLQGIQTMADSLVIITASSGSIAYYITAVYNKTNAQGQIRSVQKISGNPFRHAGGCQVYVNQMAVGVEDNQAKNRSDIMLISFNNAGHETGKRTIAHRSGAVKRSTAGAVGFTQTKSGRFMVIAGDWDSDYFDVYLSRPGIDSLYDSVSTFRLSASAHPHSYQAINLLTDTTGNTYLMCFGKINGKNLAEIYQLNFANGLVLPILKQVCEYQCRAGAGFRWASGIRVNKNQLKVYTCSRTAFPFISINIFNNDLPELLFHPSQKGN